MHYFTLILFLAFSILGFSSPSHAEDVQTAEEMPAPQVMNADTQESPAEEPQANGGNFGALMVKPADDAANDGATVNLAPVKVEIEEPSNVYTVGVDDILEISILQPEPMVLTVTVSPDGTITFPYIGKVDVKGKTTAKVQDEIQTRLADGYLKYPVVSVALKQSYSKKFSVYGEVTKPGTYILEEDATVLKAISLAGGLTRFGSSSKVKILRAKKEGEGYEIIKIDIKSIMNGQSQDVPLQAGDIVQVAEGMF